MLTLYPDQQAYFDTVRGLFATHRAVLAQAPTGFGKTIIAAKVAEGAARKQTRTAFIVHREELIDQTSESFRLCGIPHGIIAPGRPRTNHGIQVASVFTLARRQGYEFDLCIWDECHHCAAGSWENVRSTFATAKHLGLSATPQRLDNKPLGNQYETMHCSTPMRELIAMHRLSPYRYITTPVIDLSDLKRRGDGDYSHDAIEKAMTRKSITGDVISEYRRHCDGAPFIAFCHSVSAAQGLAESFRTAGYAVQSVDGNMDKTERRSVVRGLGKTLVGVCSCDLISEGYDCPGAVAGLFIRPSESLSLVLQQWGRILRYQPGKTAMLLDFVGNYTRHQLPDTPREWSLEHGVVRKSSKTVDAVEVRACSQCYAVHEWALECPYCGFVYPIKERKGPVVEAGELRELTPEEIAALELRAAKTGRLQDMHNAGKAKAARDGVAYKPGPVWMKWKYGRRHAATAAKGE